MIPNLMIIIIVVMMIIIMTLIIIILIIMIIMIIYIYIYIYIMRVIAYRPMHLGTNEPMCARDEGAGSTDAPIYT